MFLYKGKTISHTVIQGYGTCMYASALFVMGQTATCSKTLNIIQNKYHEMISIVILARFFFFFFFFFFYELIQQTYSNIATCLLRETTLKPFYFDSFLWKEIKPGTNTWKPEPKSETIYVACSGICLNTCRNVCQTYGRIFFEMHLMTCFYFRRFS